MTTTPIEAARQAAARVPMMVTKAVGRPRSRRGLLAQAREYWSAARFRAMLDDRPAPEPARWHGASHTQVQRDLDAGGTSVPPAPHARRWGLAAQGGM